MPNYEIRKERSGSAFRDQILMLMRNRRKASERSCMGFRKKLPEWYDLWRGLYTGKFTPTKNNIHIPLIWSTIWSDAARKVATAYGQWPVLGFAGSGPNDAPMCRKQEALVNAQLRDADVIEKEIGTFIAADLYGTAISQIMWDHQEEMRTRQTIQAMPLSGEKVRQIMRRKVITFDGPNYRPVDLLDAFPQPGFRTINGNQGMQWFMVRYYLDLDQCRYMASEAGGRVFDADEVERLATESNAGLFRMDEAMTRRMEARQGLDPRATMGDTMARPVELVEMWGTIPYELAGPFGSTNLVITMANDNYIFRAVDNPFEHRQKPFIKYSPTPDPHYFFAAGKAEIAAQLQIAGNRFINHQLDAADLQVHPMWIYSKNAGINTRNLMAGPGRIFGVDGDITKALMPVPMDMRGIQVGGQMTETLWRMLQIGSGVQDDTVIGAQAPGREQTAREFLGRREAAGTRLMLESVLYDNCYLEQLGDLFVSMDKQFLTFPRQVMILGESAMNDPVTGQPIATNRLPIMEEDMSQQYIARALGTTMSVSRETRKANDLTMFQILAGANDAVAGSINLVNFLRQMLMNLDYRNVNELVKQAPQVADVLARSGMEGGVGAVPEGTDGLAAMIGGGMPSGVGAQPAPMA